MNIARILADAQVNSNEKKKNGSNRQQQTAIQPQIL